MRASRQQIVAVGLLAALAGSSRARAQDPAPVRAESKSSSLLTESGPVQAVTTSPMSLAAMGLGVEYERALGDRIAVFASVEGSLLWKGWGGQAGARLYALGKALDGFFVDAHGSAYQGRFAGEPYRQYGGGVLVGRTWTLREGLLLSFGGGADLRQTESQQGGLTPTCASTVCYSQALSLPEQPSGLRVMPSVRAAVGYAF